MVEEKPRGWATLSPRRKRYWLSLVGSGLIGGLTGILLAQAFYAAGKAVGSGTHESAIGALTEMTNRPLDPTLVLLAAILWLMGMPAYCALYMSGIDEQEEHANLWACTFGWYAMIIAIPAWQLLWMGRFVPPVSIWAIFTLGFTVATVVWAWKKYRG